MNYLKISFGAAFLSLFICGCSSQYFVKDYEKGFLYQPMMQITTSPAQGMPNFAWADRSLENQINSSTTIGGGGGGGTGGCPT
jgi:hypothetical protein